MQADEQYPNIPSSKKETCEYVRVDLLLAIVPITVEVSGFERRHRTLPASVTRIERVRKALEAGDVKSALRDAEVFKLRPLN